ncbi:hypothetical protein GCM10017788_11270 [Amycolatopsis acidiphila]|nr:hypothetical protein GCM10017788_11270 [Amycolatopsis acidiphila]
MKHVLVQETRKVKAQKRIPGYQPVPAPALSTRWSRQVATIDNDNQRVSTGRTRQRCTACQKFTRLAPGDTECAACAGRLPLPIPAKGGDAR